MKINTLVLSVAALVLGVGADGRLALGQNSVSFYTVFAKANQPVPAECVQEVKLFESLAAKLPHPKSGWKFVMVCDDGSWNLAMQHIGFSGDGMEHYGETDLTGKMTLFRGEKLIHPDIGVSAEHIVAHELAHVMMQSTDELKVDQQALAWIAAQQNAPKPTIAAAQSGTGQ